MPSLNSVITRSSSVGASRPCACAMLASGTISPRRSAMRGMSSMRGTTQNTWPPRNRSRWIASRITTESNGMMKVRTASRSTGGVAIRLISRTPVSASCSVRGIGVAVSVSTCTSALQRLQPFLVGDAEMLLLVHHQQAEGRRTDRSSTAARGCR